MSSTLAPGCTFQTCLTIYSRLALYSSMGTHNAGVGRAKHVGWEGGVLSLCMAAVV